MLNENVWQGFDKLDGLTRDLAGQGSDQQGACCCQGSQGEGRGREEEGVNKLVRMAGRFGVICVCVLCMFS